MRWMVQQVELTAILQPIDLAERLGGILEVADRHCERDGLDGEGVGDGGVDG